jgi:hypothetical protein
MAASIPPHAAVYGRVQDLEEYRGTIRYIGPVAAAKNPADIWLGIEWDDSSRGKHDGSCLDSKGSTVRHFQCEAGSGSFVKPNKLNFGKTFEDAMGERYVGLDAPEESPGDIVPDAFVMTSSGVAKSIEFVGEHKIRKRQQLDVINKITMRNFSVSTAGDISAVAGHFIEIDLQDNLLSSWVEVGKVAVQLPLLSTFLLHGNKMEPFTMDTLRVFPERCFESLRVLALNGCSLRSWNEVVQLETCLPNVEELYLAANNLSDVGISGAEGRVSASTESFKKLRILDVAACQIGSWEQLITLSACPMLEEIVLDGNPIASVLPCAPGHFPTLRRISASSTG